MATSEGTIARQGVAREEARVGPRLRRVADATEVAPIGKLSANVDADLYEHLRELAHLQRVSESSIVDLALRRFFAVGDDDALGVILHEAGASLRRKQSAKRRS